MIKNKSICISPTAQPAARKAPEFINRRQHERLTVNHGLLAFYNKIALGQINNINENGLSFSYYHNKDAAFGKQALPSQGLLDIVSTKNEFWLCDLPAVLIFNIEQETLYSADYSVVKYCCGIKFSKIVNQQMFKLKRLLSNCFGNLVK